MKHVIDARGLACPQPVILTRKKMKEYDQLVVLVDNSTAVENLTRLATGSGWNVSSSVSGSDFEVTMSGTVQSDASNVNNTVEELCCGNNSFIAVISSDVMGQGDNELGVLLMKAFIHTLASFDDLPAGVLFYNSGVRLAAEGSDVLDDLAVLENSGCEILVCGTCVNYFGLGEKIKAGKISNMFDIVESMKNSAKIIRP